MKVEKIPFSELLSNVVDNRGKTCPTADAGIPLIATNCIRNELLYPTYDKVRYVSQETYDTWFRGHPKPGDIIFVNKATPGRVCLVPDPVDFCIAQDMVAVRADEKKVLPKFLFALLRSPAVQARIEQMHVGTLIPHFKKGDFDNLLLSIPGREAQEFIGDFYFELSQKIDTNRRINETLQAIAQTLFKSWFIDSTLTKLPKGWRETTLEDAIEIHDSKRIPLSSRERAERKGKIPYHGAASVMDYVDDYLFDGVYVLIGEDGSVVNEDNTPVLQYVWGQFWVNNHAHVLSGKNGVSIEHLFLFLKTVNIRPCVTGAVQPKLNQGNLCRVPFVLPPETICKEFAALIEPMFARIRANAEESRTLVELRDALLPKLLSGELVFSKKKAVKG